MIETRTGVIWLGDDGIVHCRVIPNVDRELADTQRVVAAIAEVAHERKRPVLVDMRGMEALDQGARSYLSGEDTVRYVSALALIVDTEDSRALGIHFMVVNHPPFPVRIFSEEADAIAWLKRYAE